MKLKILLIVGAILATHPIFSQPLTFEDSVAYAYGQVWGKKVKDGGADLDFKLIAKAVSESNSVKPLLSEKMIQSLMGRYQPYLKKKRLAEMPVKNLEASNKFLIENKLKPNIVSLRSGLQYEVIKGGDPNAKSPRLSDNVTVNYEGKHLDGRVFDSSYQTGEPFSSDLKSLIKGWREGIRKMKPGDVFIFYIPAELAYGETGDGDKIGPNELLIFKVELVCINLPEPKSK